MRYHFFITALIVLLGGVVLSSDAAPQEESRSSGGVNFAVVELFTSEGCNSCPPADRVLTTLTGEAMRGRTQVYPIAWHVDYWDRLGWPDPYSSRDYSRYQRSYAANLPSRVYTPQMIVNGKRIIYPAQRLSEAREVIQQALIRDRSQARIELTPELNGGELTVSYTIAPVPRDTQLAVVVVERELSNHVLRGENAGRVLRHTNTARAVEWEAPRQSGSVTIKIPDDLRQEHSGVIAFLQHRNSMQIVAAAGADL